MNGTEQRQRHTAVTRLEQDVETVLEAFQRETLEREAALARTFAVQISDERTARLSMARESTTLQTRAINALEVLTNQTMNFQHRGFWSRLNWLLTGR